MTKAYVQMVGRIAYLWGWPLVHSINRSIAFSKAPEPGLLGGVVPVAFNRNAMLTSYVKPAQHFVTVRIRMSCTVRATWRATKSPSFSR